MEPNSQPNTQPTPEPQQLTQPPAEAAQHKRTSRRTIAALWCLIGPTALLIVTFILYAVINYIGTSTSANGSLSSGSSIFNTISNIVIFLIGALAFITWLPGVIVGIILLANKKSVPPQA
jgi:hypothetical protein